MTKGRHGTLNKLVLNFGFAILMIPLFSWANITFNSFISRGRIVTLYKSVSHVLMKKLGKK